MEIRRVRVALNERAIVHLDDRPTRYLRPGRHWVLVARPLVRLRIAWHDTDALVAKLRAEELELVPAEDLRVLRLAPHERAVVVQRGRPVRWLAAGEHQVWTVDRVVRRDGRVVSEPAVTVDVLDTSEVVATPLREDVKALAPASDYVETTVPHGAVAVRYVDGVLDAILGPGRHAAWTTLRKVAHATVDMRERMLNVTGQEVMTRDHVTLRLNLAATYRVADAQRLATVAREPDDVLHLAVQLAAREAVATRTLDELLATRDALMGALLEDVGRRADAVGLVVLTLALKDVILPGEMKTLLNKVIEAQKEAEANVILRREETAATRSLAQTAKVLAENPLLIRLKELEAYGNLAAKVGQVHLILGEAALPKLELRT